MKYVSKDKEGVLYLDEKGIWELEEAEFVLCFNKNEKNPRYFEFLCCVCNKYLKSLRDGMNHWQHAKHRKEAIALYKKLNSFKRIPYLSQKQEIVLSEFLQGLLVDHHTLTEKHIIKRNEIRDQIDTTLWKAGLKEVFCRVYGSSLTGIGFEDACVDIDIQYDIPKLSARIPTITCTSSFYIHLVSVLKSSDLFCDVTDHFHKKIPSLTFTHVETGLRCCVDPMHKHGFHTSSLLKKYLKLDDRVKTLCLVFKYWAKLCGIHNPTTCGLSPYCFTLMMIHYLQQVNPPVIPIIETNIKYDHHANLDWEDEKNHSIVDEEIDSWKSTNTDSVGKLWIGLFKYYLVTFRMKALVVNIRQYAPLARVHMQYGNRRIAIEDPFMNDDNVASTMNSSTVMAYFSQCMEISLKYFSCYKEYRDEKSVEKSVESSEVKKELHEDVNIKELREDASDNLDTEEDKDTQEDSDSDVVIESDTEEGSKDVNREKKNATVDESQPQEVYEQNGKLTDEGVESKEAFDKNDVESNQAHDVYEQNRKLTDEDVENKEALDKNDVESNQTHKVYEQNRKLTDEDVENKETLDKNDVESNQAHKVYEQNRKLTDEDIENKEALDKNDVESNQAHEVYEQNRKLTNENIENKEALDKNDVKSKSKTSKTLDSTDNEIELTEKIDNMVIGDVPTTSKTLPIQVSEEDTTVVNELQDYKFHRSNFTPRKGMPLVCIECLGEGHTYDKCQYLHLTFTELKPLKNEFIKTLDLVCEDLMKSCELPSKEFEIRLRVLKVMEDHLKNTFRDDCRLSLFGSSVNGFGFQGSDMDICLRFREEQHPANLNSADMVVQVSKALDKHPDFHKIMYIKSAKVPIVKFVASGVQLEGDISLYNCLALDNSAMLATYATIDRRVRILGYCMKVLAKFCEIGDASRGSLSSYAHILLVLYYLQHCEPPVIPVLQELYDKSKGKPKRLVEGWNTWFYDDLQNLPKVWSGYGKNKQSIGELILGFFRFYLERFDFNRDVVAIKQRKRLTKFEKSWTRATMAIEDPFNLKHNLGAGIRRNMYKYIMTCYINARLRFGTTTQKLPFDNIVELQRYFFDPIVLTGNKDVPKDRLCRRCGRIGHVAANCAERFVAQRDRRKRRDSEKAEEINNVHDNERPIEKENMKKTVNDKSVVDSPDANLRCHICRQRGHRKIDCPNKKKQDERKLNKAPGAERSSRKTNLNPTSLADNNNVDRTRTSNIKPYDSTSTPKAAQPTAIRDSSSNSKAEQPVGVQNSTTTDLSLGIPIKRDNVNSLDDFSLVSPLSNFALSNPAMSNISPSVRMRHQVQTQPRSPTGNSVPKQPRSPGQVQPPGFSYPTQSFSIDQLNSLFATSPSRVSFLDRNIGMSTMDAGTYPQPNVVPTHIGNAPPIHGHTSPNGFGSTSRQQEGDDVSKRLFSGKEQNHSQNQTMGNDNTSENSSFSFSSFMDDFHDANTPEKQIENSNGKHPSHNESKNTPHKQARSSNEKHSTPRQQSNNKSKTKEASLPRNIPQKPNTKSMSSQHRTADAGRSPTGRNMASQHRTADAGRSPTGRNMASQYKTTQPGSSPSGQNAYHRTRQPGSSPSGQNISSQYRTTQPGSSPNGNKPHQRSKSSKSGKVDESPRSSDDRK